MKKKPIPKGLTIVEKKIQGGYKLKKNQFVFGRIKYWEGLIEVDPRQNSEEMMDTLIHECLHWINPEWSERQVKNSAGLISEVLWGLKFRRIKD